MLHKWLASWYQPRVWSYFLLPFSALFLLIILLRRLAYRLKLFKSHSFSVPIIVVGNLTVGGTGKTPLVIALAQYLKNQGYQPGIVSRGYGGDNTYPQIVTPMSTVSLVGDEALLLAKQTACPMVICRQRVLAVKKLLEEFRCNVVICDDGLQHYALARQVEIAVIDGKRRYGNRFLLPAGPLREPISRVKRVDFRVVNGGIAQQGEYAMQLIPTTVYQLCNPQNQQSLETLANHTVHAVAGIGNPEQFFTLLTEKGLHVIPHPMPDHHHYSAEDIQFNDDYLVLMTEKDAVKCQAFMTEKHWCLVVKARLSESFYAELLQSMRFKSEE